MALERLHPFPRMSEAVRISDVSFLAGQVPNDMADFPGMHAVWYAWVHSANPPARATGGVALARPGMRVEMIVVARAPN